MRTSALLRRSLLALSLCSLATLAACKKREEAAKPIVTVQTAPVQQTTLVQTVEAEATLFPIDQAAITPKVSSPVARFFVNRGSRVQKGELLAELENRDLTASEIESRGAFEQAQATYSSATKASLPEEWTKAELDASAAKQVLDAEQKLYASREDLYKQGAMPRKELDQAALSLTQARNQYQVAQQHLDALHSVAKADQLKGAKAQLDSAHGKLMGATAQLQYSKVYSPITGVVAERPLYAGETAAAGAPLLVIVDASRIVAKAHLSQQQAALVKAGDAASITAPGLDEPVAGKVTVVSPATDPGSTTIEVWVQADNRSGALHPGTSAHLSIAVAKLAQALVVPSSAIVETEGKSTVMLVGAGNIAKATEVKLGVRQGEQTQILDGVKPGDTVVTVGAYGLPDGAQIQTPAAEKPGAKEKDE